MINGEVDVAVGGKSAVTFGEAVRLQDRTGEITVVTPTRRHGGSPRFPSDLDARGRLLVHGANAGDRYIGVFRLRPGARVCGKRVDVTDAANQAAAQETDEQHEDQAQHQPPGRAEVQRVLEK